MGYPPALVRPKLLLLPGTTFASHRLPIATAALERGFEVHVAAPATADRGPVEHEHLHHHRLSLSRAPIALRRELGAALDVRHLLHRLEPDLVHLFTPRVIATVGPIVRMYQRAAIVATITGLGYSFLYEGATAGALRWGVSQAFRLTFAHPRAHVIVQNRDDLHELSIRGVLDAEHTTLIPGSGVDLEEYAPPPTRDASPPLVVFAGRLLWDKGVGEFVDAARLVRSRGRAARFVLAGASDPHNPRHVPQASLDRWAEEGVVEVRGHCDDMVDMLQRTDVFCLPSYREGMPRALLEAAACGCALIASDAPGTRDFVVDDRHGKLVPPRDAVALAEAIIELIDDPVRRHAIGLAARDRVEREFGRDRIARQVLAVYDGLLDAT